MAPSIDKEALERFLQSQEPRLARIVARVTTDMRDMVTYEQIRNALLSGMIDEGWIQKWRELYSEFVANELAKHWHIAMVAAVALDEQRHGGRFVFDDQSHAVQDWAQERAAALVTNVLDGQRRALRALVERAVSAAQGMGVDELAMVIRPIIGLRMPQAKANLRYFERVKDTLTRKHPRTSPDKIIERARRAAARYAEHQHRARAAMIARTELVAAYNAGRFFSVGQQMGQGLLPRMRAVWVTAGDARVCEKCRALEKKQVAYGDQFVSDGKSAKYSDGRFPPLHPRCRCVLAYVEEEVENQFPFET